MRIDKDVGSFGIFNIVSSKQQYTPKVMNTCYITASVTRLGYFLDFGQLLKAFGNN